MSSSTQPTDAELLKALARAPATGSLQPLLDRYLAFVFSSALRRTGNASDATEVTRAVFQVLTRRARRIRKKTALAGWLFHVASVAARKLRRGKKTDSSARWFRWFRRRTVPVETPEASPWVRLTPSLC